MSEVTFYTRKACGLCDETLADLRALRDELGFDIVERDIDADPELRDRYNDIVPVVAVGGEVVARAPVDATALRAALAAALRHAPAASD